MNKVNHISPHEELGRVGRVRAAIGAVLGAAATQRLIDRPGGVRILDSAALSREVAGWCEVPVPLRDSPDPLGRAAFEKWFGDSVVLNGDGTPLPVFHATKAGDFTVFDLGRASPSNRFGPGFYFTQDKATLDVYGDGGRVVSAYLRITRPQIGDALTEDQIESFFGALQDKVFPNGFDATQAHAIARERALQAPDEAFAVLLSAQCGYISTADWVRGMDAMAIDGIIREVNGHPEYVVLHPEQIKSAVDNNGQYDPNNPDIMHSLGQELHWTAGSVSSPQIAPLFPAGAIARQGEDAAVAEQYAQERAAVERALQRFAGDGCAVYAHAHGDHWKMIGRDAQRQWFVQGFDMAGPLGRTVHEDQASAECELGAGGHGRRDDQAFALARDLPGFQRGLFASDVWSRVGTGEISFAEGNRRLSEYDGHAAARLHAGARVAQAFYTPKDDTVILIADRIAPGREVAVFLHEIMHKHGPRVVGAAGMRRLVDGVKAWASAPQATTERSIHDAANARARASAWPAAQAYDEELLAYAVEEAVSRGVRPALEGREGSAEQWLGDVVATLRGVIVQITQGAAPDLDAQQIVDLAYALAQMESPEHGPKIREQLETMKSVHAGSEEDALARVIYHVSPLPEFDGARATSIRAAQDLWNLLDDRRQEIGLPVAEHDEIEAKMRALERLEHSMREDDRAFGNNAGIDANAFYATSQPDYWRDTQADELGLNYESGGIYAVLTKVMPEESMVTSGMGQQAPEAAISPNNVERILGPYQTKAEADAAVRSAYDVRSHPRRKTETAEFQVWFGDSKVVDANGKPLVVYHGTDQSFFAFDRSKISSRTGDGASHLGFYFSSNKQVATYFTDGNDVNGLMLVYLSIANPYRMTADEFEANMSAMDAEEAQDIRASLERDGHDGIIVGQGAGGGFIDSDGETYIVFRPEQVKSAISNNDQFDPDNTDIRFSRAPGHGRDVLASPTGDREEAIYAPRSLSGPVANESTATAPDIGGAAFGRALGDLPSAVQEMLAAEKALEVVRSGDPNGVTLDRWMALSDRSLKAKKALTAELSRLRDDGFALQAQASGGRMVTLTQSAQQPGKWQLTRFSADGAPWGDTNHASKDQAIREFIDEADLSSMTDGAGAPFSRASTPSGQAQPEAFKVWFGASKAVDASGKPLVVYHGRDGNFSQFNTNGGPGKTSGTGAFFSSRPIVADTYAIGTEPNVAPVYLSLQTPVIIDAQGRNWDSVAQSARVHLPAAKVSDQADENLLAQLEGVPPKQGVTRNLKAKNTTVREIFKGEWDYPDDTASTDDLARWARKQGYDGVVIHNVKDRGPSGRFATDEALEPSTIYVAFRPEQIKSAIGNIGAFDSANPDIRFSFAGPSADGADARALAAAQERIEAGEAADVIRRDTGWFQGPDSKWRYEISDDQADIISVEQWGMHAESGNLRLTDMLHHPALFAAYPLLGEIPVTFRKSTGARAAMFCGEMQIDSATFQIEGLVGPAGGYARRDLLRTVLHEVQHAIQGREGFASGGNWMDAFADPRMRPTATACGLRAAQQLLSDRLTAIAAPLSLEEFARQAWSGSEVTDEVQASYAQYCADTRAAAGKRSNQVLAQEWAAKEWYRRLAGEVEARNVSVRLPLTPQERVDRAPGVTADVAGADVIVLFGGQEMHDAAPPVNIQRCWHGSPYRFDRFDLARVRSGEGALAFGWGVYLAGAKEVARNYTGVEGIGGASVPHFFAIKGVPTQPRSPEQKAADLICGMGLQGARKLARGMLMEAERGEPWTMDRGLDYYAAIARITNECGSRMEVKRSGGFLYEASIPTDGYLLWDAPMCDQPPEVLSALREHGFGRGTTRAGEWLVHMWGALRGEGFEDIASLAPGAPQEAMSRWLSSIGIHGIQYLDAYTRSGCREASFNYVVFQETDVQIERAVEIRVAREKMA